MFGPFRNEPLTDFQDPMNKDAMEAALLQVMDSAKKAKPIPLFIGGRKVKARETFTTTNPAHPKMVLGKFYKAGKKEAKLAVAAAEKAFPAWAAEPAQRRAEIMINAAALMRRHKFELIATMVLEVGKNWVEADADLAEAIDFLEYYAREIMYWDQGMEVA